MLKFDSGELLNEPLARLVARQAEALGSSG